MPKSTVKAVGAGQKSGKTRKKALSPIKESTQESHAHEPTPQTRTLAMLAVAVGYTQEQIARTLKISEPTLRKHYAVELAEGAEQANLKVAGNLFRIATQTVDNKAALTAAIFWMKTRMKWRDNTPITADAEIDADGPVRVRLKIGDREGNE